MPHPQTFLSRITAYPILQPLYCKAYLLAPGPGMFETVALSIAGAHALCSESYQIATGAHLDRPLRRVRDDYVTVILQHPECSCWCADSPDVYIRRGDANVGPTAALPQASAPAHVDAKAFMFNIL